MLEGYPPQNIAPEQPDLAGLEKIENEERPFTIEEAGFELDGVGTKGVILKEEIADITGRKWPEGTAGHVVNKKRLAEGGYALIIWPTNNESEDALNHTPPPIVVKSIVEYKKFFTRIPVDPKPTKKTR